MWREVQCILILKGHPWVPRRIGLTTVKESISFIAVRSSTELSTGAMLARIARLRGSTTLYTRRQHTSYNFTFFDFAVVII